MAYLPVLMYHNITADNNAGQGLTISAEKLEEQFRYLRKKQYTSLHVSELEGMAALVPKSVVITFDDVTENQLLYAVPLLEKYSLKATFFIPFNYIGKTDEWNDGTEKIMSVEQLQGLDTNLIQLGYHSFLHRRYAALDDKEIDEDFAHCEKVIKASGLKVYPALAYPYGNYPKQSLENAAFKKLLEKNGMKMGLRIGNRINKFPLHDKFEIQRIDVKGEFSFFKFRLMLKFGKLL